MRLDGIVKSAIEEASELEGAAEASGAIIRLVERFVANELPENQIASSLQGIYEVLKGYT